MYKAIGEAAYNDGLFSQAAPFQKYQASVSQFGDGAIGALARSPRWQFRHKPMSGAGSATADGSLGRTFLPAFGPRAMRGLGHAYHDGSLGDTLNLEPCTPIRMCMNDVLSAPQPLDRAMADPFNKLVAATLVGIVGYLVFKR